MRFQTFLILGIICLFLCTAFTIPCLGQYREYYIFGKIVDIDDQPIPKVEIFLRNIKTSRRYKISTDKNGNFKLIGLPHGIYEATMQKEGYETKTDEWNFDTPQERMQKVELQTIVMVTTKQIQEIQQAERAQSDFKEATEKIRQADFEGAMIILEKMKEENPEDANAHYLLGIVYLRKMMLSEAIEALTKTTELSPSFAGAYHELGLCYQQQKELDKALQYYEKAIELEPNSVESLYNEGLILFELGRVPEALTYFEKALELKPNDPEFLEMAGRCYIHQGDFPKAIEYLERARDKHLAPEKKEFLEGLIEKLKEQIKQ